MVEAVADVERRGQGGVVVGEFGVGDFESVEVGGGDHDLGAGWHFRGLVAVALGSFDGAGARATCFVFLWIPASGRCAQRPSFRRKPESRGEGRRGSATDSRSKLTRQQLCTEPLRVSFAEGIERLDSRWFEVLNVASYNRQSML